MATSSAEHILHPRVLLFSAALVLLSAAASCQAQAVLDADGDPVLIGCLYRLNLDGIGFFGGLTALSPVNDTTCGRYVGLGEETDPGLPVSITPGSRAASGILGVDVRSKIAFQTLSPGPCADSGTWTAAAASSSETGPFTAVVAGRGPESPPATREWFEVRETDQERAYRLIYCPTCLQCDLLCLAEVGGYHVDGKTVLGVGSLGDPAPLSFPVRFVKYQPRLATSSATT